MSNVTRERTEVLDGMREPGAPSAVAQPPAQTERGPEPASDPLEGAGIPDRRSARRTGWLRRRSALVWLFRLPIALPLVFMTPEFVSLALGRPGAVTNISFSEADVFGMSALLLFLMMLTVTPLHTVTGWRWQRPLRRDYGVAMFVVATMDLVCAATTTGDTFPGGFLTRIGGHTFLLAGTLSTLLLVPLALTANRRAQRWLGPHWKWLHRLVYVIWVTILIHLAFLFAFRSIFIDALLVSAPLALLRIPAVRDRWGCSRKARSHRAVRWAALCTTAGVYGVGYVLLVREFISVGVLAFTQHPSS